MWKNWEGEVPTTVSETIAKHEVSEDDYPNINTILTIVDTLPVTSCSCERSCSTLRKLKTFNRTTMLEERLNGLALYRGYPCFGLAAIFAWMLYSVQHPEHHAREHNSFKIARQVTRGHWLNGLNGEYYGNDLFCLQSRMSEVDTLYTYIDKFLWISTWPWTNSLTQNQGECSSTHLWTTKFTTGHV